MQSRGLLSIRREALLRFILGVDLRIGYPPRLGHCRSLQGEVCVAGGVDDSVLSMSDIRSNMMVRLIVTGFVAGDSCSNVGWSLWPPATSGPSASDQWRPCRSH